MAGIGRVISELNVKCAAHVVMSPHVQHLVVDTNAFINGAPLRDIGENIYTIQEVIDEVKCRKQLQQLSVLSFDLIIKDVFAENIKFITDFSKKTGDYLSLSAADIKVMALVYQLEKEKVGVSHLRDSPVAQTANLHDIKAQNPTKGPGFFQKVTGNEAEAPESKDDDSDEDCDDLMKRLEELKVEPAGNDADLLVPVENAEDADPDDDDEESSESDGDDWITIGNIEQVKKDSGNSETIDKTATVACITADFAMQNVLKQIGLNVSAYDGRLVRRVRTYILRCVACFKTTSVLTKRFCPKCGHQALKKVSVTLDEEGNQHIYINYRRPLTSRGKRFSLPAPKGGHLAQNPVLNEDDLRPHQKPSKLARMKNNPLNSDYVAGYSPFVMRDVNSKSAVLGIRQNGEFKNWMRKNPNEARKKRK